MLVIGTVVDDSIVVVEAVQARFDAGYRSAYKASVDAIRAIREVARKELPVGYGIEFSGITREESQTGSNVVVIFLVPALFVLFQTLQERFKPVEFVESDDPLIVEEMRKIEAYHAAKAK